MRKIVLVGTLMLVSLTGCNRMVPLQPTTQVLVSNATTETEVRAAIARALPGRQFVAESEVPGQIVARMTHRGTTLRVQIDYNASGYVLTYLDSQGLNFQIDEGTGTPMISRHYDRYIQRLRAEIDGEIARPAREAQEAIEDQREYEIELAEQQREAEYAQQQAQLNAQQSARNHELERERIRAQAQVDAAHASRPVVLDVRPQAINRLRFDVSVQAPSRFGVTQLTSGFLPDPFVVQGQAGGNVNTNRMRFPRHCEGWYTGQPEHVVVLTTPMNYVRFDALSNDDVTLALVAPDGNIWCDDDGAGGTNSRIHGAFPAGTYHVYVGNYRRGVVAPYQLHVSERQVQQQVVVQQQQQQHVIVQQQQQAPQPAAPDCRSVVLNAGHHAMHLDNCQGAEPYCAQALIQAGHHPMHLDNCRGVNAQCAVTLLQRGQHPMHLSNCQ